MTYKVKAVARNRKTGFQIGRIRTETINPKTNQLFRGVKTKAQVKKRYEAFWNKLNPKSKEVVSVLKVEKK